ncbi:hypothetical protein [Fimbriiglobus ruber]|uniref:Uncharacterized protein n=1 Tax=Fimbriiglobus ruber TaxID=1908690 RepID=A0A225DAT5_9BACT|nr:hypothetical protein [Fimbriiglobus ruber]OWK34249.1 hypothetical protein FRUB_10220 [Fimbriiglobus ruber]
MPTSHTGGVWEAAIDPDDDIGQNIPIEANGAPIAEVLGSDNFPCLDPDEDDFEAIHAEAAATARLIATDGLFLAEEILQALGHRNGREVSDVTRQEMEPIRKLAAALVAKGKGE